MDEDDNVVLVAKRNISQGEEIFTGYGKDYWDKHPPYNPNTATNQISDDFRIVRQQALDNLPVNPSEARNISKMSPQEQAAYQIERQKQADIVAYFTIKSTMGEQKAAQFQYQAGLTDAELLGGGGGSAPAPSKPAAPGAPGGDVLWSDMFGGAQ